MYVRVEEAEGRFSRLDGLLLVLVPFNRLALHGTDFCLCCVCAFFAVVPPQPNISPRQTCLPLLVLFLESQRGIVTAHSATPRLEDLSSYDEYDSCFSLSTPSVYIRGRQINIAMAPALKPPVPPRKYEFAIDIYRTFLSKERGEKQNWEKATIDILIM